MTSTSPQPTQQKIFAQMPKVMRDIGAIGKERLNKQQGFNYRGIEDLYNHAQKILAEHGVFSVVSSTKRIDSVRKSSTGSNLYHAIITFQIRYYADDGSFIEHFVDGEAMDSGDKVTNKCISIADKYSLLTTLKIPTADLNDPDAESPQIAQPQHQAAPSRTSRPTTPRAKAFTPRKPESEDAPYSFDAAESSTVKMSTASNVAATTLPATNDNMPLNALAERAAKEVKLRESAARQGYGVEAIKAILNAEQPGAKKLTDLSEASLDKLLEIVSSKHPPEALALYNVSLTPKQ